MRRISKNLTKYSAMIAGVILANNANAIDAGIALHQGNESNTQGFSLDVSDSFSKGSNFHWGASYQTLDDVKVEWNQRDLYFKLDTLAAYGSYRYQPKSYNAVMKKLSLDYFAGVSVTLTENKFDWPNLNTEKYFSEKGDVNPFIGFAAHYSFTKKSSLDLGFKYQPSFSDLGNITSVYLGITYKFGKQVGY